MDSKSTPRVVVVGAGFGGLNAAVLLARYPVHVTVVDRKNHHTFQPLLYQVAAAGLSADLQRYAAGAAEPDPVCDRGDGRSVLLPALLTHRT